MTQQEKLLDRFLHNYPWQHRSKENAIKAMNEFAKLKCKEQQQIAKDHLVEVGQTEFLTGKDVGGMPYPKF